MINARQFNVHSRFHQEVSDPDAFDVGIEAIFHLDAILILLSIIDGRRVGEIFDGEGASLAAWLEDIAGICLAFSSEATTRFDQLEAARKKLQELRPPKRGARKGGTR